MLQFRGKPFAIQEIAPESSMMIGSGCDGGDRVFWDL
jgi:hypothetical protein